MTEAKEKCIIRIFNDTSKPLTVRLVSGFELYPRFITLQPQKQIAVFMKTTKVFLKVWDNNLIMLKEEEG